MSIKEIALDLTVFTLSNVNDAISFKPQLCFEVPKLDYQTLKENYINFTGTSIRKNRSKLFFLPTNVSDELQKLNPSIPEDAKSVPNDGRVYYKNRLITELDYENVKRVETACAFIAYTALNSFVHFETELPHSRHSPNHEHGYDDVDDDSEDELSPSESVNKALRKGNILGFRELGHLVGITPWHFHRVFKVITGLTIREYGQLCVEFIKKNKEIVNTCRIKVEQMKNSQRYSCLDDSEFLKDGTLQYAATENVVLLHEYFIDPNKSKEFKTRKNGQTSNNVVAKSDTNDDAAPAMTQRSEIRKRRSSVMYGRMQRASQSSITSNSSLYECLTSSSKTELKSPEYYLSNEEHPHSDNETDDSNSSVLEPPGLSIFPAPVARSVSPPITSRKGSIISIGSSGAISKKTGKRKSVTGANIDAIQSTMLHRRNRSDGCTVNLSFEPLQTELSLDARLSPSPNQYPIEFNSNVFNSSYPPQVPTPDSKSVPFNGSSMNGQIAGDDDDDDRIDFSVGPLDYHLTNANLPSSTEFTKNQSDKLNNATSMTDISLFNNSLMDQTTPANASAMNLILENGLPTDTTASSTTYATDNDLYKRKNDFTMEEILNSSNPFAPMNLTATTNSTTMDGVSHLTPISNNNNLGNDYFLNGISTEDDGLLFDSALAAAEGLVAADTNFITSTASATTASATNVNGSDTFNF